MKTYISVGIGDMMCLDSLMTQQERDRISEIYWACRFGKDIIPLFENNKFYPNLKAHHTIPDDIGSNAMSKLDITAVDFWHFRPDFVKNFEVGLSLFNLTHFKSSLNVINAAGYFLDRDKKFTNSSFLDSANQNEVNWEDIGVVPENYILFHYPTSTRPRTDIATINDSDWTFIDSLSKDTNLKVIIISDTEIDKKIENSLILLKPSIRSIVALTKFAKYYAGCDSFISILSSKVLDPKNIFIKSHDQNIEKTVMTNVWLQRFFQPHPPEVIRTFYKNYIGR